MDIQGKFVKFLEPVTGDGKNGSWKRQDFVMELPGDFPKKLCIANWNDKVDLSGLKEGDTIKAHIDLESREYNGKWYTDVKLWKLEKQGKSNSESEDKDHIDLPKEQPSFPTSKDSEDDDLPF